MSTAEIINIENNRTLDNLKSIYLYKFGNFYRAYELSAYYAHFFNESLNENDRLKVSKVNNSKINDEIVKVGIPGDNEKSFKKYFNDATITKINKDILHIRFSDEKFSEININNYKKKCSEWKNNFSLTTFKNKEKEHNNTEEKSSFNKTPKLNTVYNNPSSFTNIMRTILKYDTFDKDEKDLRSFISNLKEMCCSLI